MKKPTNKPPIINKLEMEANNCLDDMSLHDINENNVKSDKDSMIFCEYFCLK